MVMDSVEMGEYGIVEFKGGVFRFKKGDFMGMSS